MVAKPISFSKAVFEITGCNPFALIQNGIKLEFLNVYFKAESHESSIRETSSDVDRFSF